MRGMRRELRTSACWIEATGTIAASGGQEREQSKRVKASAEEIGEAVMDVGVPQGRMCGGSE
eukprot:2136784-Pleurochrysis_carterae.AAC.1